MKLLLPKSKPQQRSRKDRLRGTASFLFGAWKSRPLSRRLLYLVSIILALTGIGMLSYPIATDVISNREQVRLEAEFESPEFRTSFEARQVEPGRVLTRIVVPRLGVDALVVEGTDARALRAGAGHYKHSSLPCETGNVSIAGHRTTYGKPFSRFDELKAGDEIILITPTRRCTYRVVVDGPKDASRPTKGAAGWITHPQDGAVVGPLQGQWLTLTTCHPKGSAEKRLIVRAEMIQS